MGIEVSFFDHHQGALKKKNLVNETSKNTKEYPVKRFFLLNLNSLIPETTGF
jgi:hypothetical protein